MTSRLSFPVRIALGLLLTVACASACAQVAPSAFRRTASLNLGATYSNFSPDFPNGSSLRMGGIGAFASFRWKYHVGVEAEARFLRFNSFYDQTQDGYLAGPRVGFLEYGRLRPYAKVLVGESHMQFPFKIATGNYLTLAPGGGLDYRLTRHIFLRADYEYQFWPQFPNFRGVPNNGLSPNGASVGVAYRLFGR